MIDDFKSPVSRKPKGIEPLANINTNEPAILDEPITEGAATASPEAYEPAQAPASSAINASWQSPDSSNEVPSDQGDSAEQQTNDSQAPKKRFHISWPPSKRQKIIGSVLAVVLAFGLGALYTHFHHTKPVVAETVKPKVVKKVAPPKIIYSTLTGLPVADDSVNQRPVVATMIENSLDARPQSGLDQAGIVFEAIAEGGVTRFMAVFQDTQPSYIGPVRSARPYYVQWALGFDAAYAHVGGSPDALNDIKSWNVRDLDQFHNGGSYQRISSRYAPHNVYTSVTTLAQLAQSKGYNTSTYTGFSRKADQPYKAPTPATATQPAKTNDTRTAANTIDMIFSGPAYNSHFDYDASTNSYKRSEAGQPHMEADASGKQTQITPKVVVAMVVPMVRGALDASGAYYSDYNPVGTGQIFVFQDGTVTQGTWSKASINASLSFNDASGQPLKLNRGQTWIGAITAAGNVQYK